MGLKEDLNDAMEDVVIFCFVETGNSSCFFPFQSLSLCLCLSCSCDLSRRGQLKTTAATVRCLWFREIATLLYFFFYKTLFSVALRSQKPQGLLGTGSPGRPTRLSHSS